MELGKLESGSKQGIPPISIPPTTTSGLQIQFGTDIVVCSQNTTDCHIWIEGKLIKKDEDAIKHSIQLVLQHNNTLLAIVQCKAHSIALKRKIARNLIFVRGSLIF